MGMMQQAGGNVKAGAAMPQYERRKEYPEMKKNFLL
jgi:hypothetical protein